MEVMVVVKSSDNSMEEIRMKVWSITVVDIVTMAILYF